MVVIDEWLKQLSPEDKKDGLKRKKKYLKQVKILKDQEKVDVATGETLASGLGFAQFEDEDLSLFAVRYLNNMELVPNKGLVVDFSLEDARQIRKREIK